MEFPEWQSEKWEDYPGNPVIGLDENDEARAAIGDPQILTPGDYDSKWHAFYHGFFGKDFAPHFHHRVSDDGFSWTLRDMLPWRVNPCYLFRDGGLFYLYYTAILDGEEMRKTGINNAVRVRVTADFENWSDSLELIRPELPWEREHTPGYVSVEARNPCVIKTREGKYRLYYSAGTVKLEDCGYEEPKYISFAEADSPLGPFKKHKTPILAPDAAIPHRNLGAGAIKVFGYRGGYLALYNGIYTDAENRSRSAICVLISEDGISWREAPYNPIIAPAEGWKKALVYQLDLVKYDGELRLYYNARDGWRGGTERIGLSVLKNDKTDVYKLW
jgi:predicted GH43/DUF377 family glycosyl hydrolase